MSAFKTAAAFALGAATGALSTWFIIRERYAEKMREERAALRESMRKTPKNIVKTETTEDENEQSAPAIKYGDYVNQAKRYAPGEYNIVPGSEDEEGESEPTVEKIDPVEDYRDPYVVSMDEFATMDGHDAVTLTYFRDGVLADENYDRITDVEATVGDALERLEQYGEDCVYVRNERLRVDYEILRDMRSYHEILEQKPYLRT